MGKKAKSDKENSQPRGQDEMPVEITFHYIKGNSFRVIHVDGAYGGPSPAGDFIEMALYNERIPIPVQTVQDVKDGKLADEKTRVARSGVVREMECNAIMSIETAEVLAAWLTKHVNRAKARKEGKDVQDD